MAYPQTAEIVTEHRVLNFVPQTPHGEEVRTAVEEMSAKSIEAEHPAYKTREAGKVASCETSGKDFQGKVSNSDEWSSVAEPQTSFQQGDEELPAFEPAEEDAGEGKEEDGLQQIGAVFENQSGECNEPRSTAFQQPNQQDTTNTSNHDERGNRSLQPALVKDGSS